MTHEERDFIDELMVSGLTETSWKNALADIVKLQTAKIFLDSLLSVGLSAESWTKAKNDIVELLKTKTFVDSLRTAGFSRSTWEQVYAAALAAGGSAEPVEEPEEDITELDDGTIIPEGFIGKTYRAKGTVTVGHFIVTNAKFTVVADDIIIVEGIKFTLIPDTGAGIWNASFTKPEDSVYKIVFTLNSCSVVYRSSEAAAVNGIMNCRVMADDDVTVKSDYVLVLKDTITVNMISGFDRITSPVSQGYFVYDDLTGSPYGVGYSSEGTVDIRVTYDIERKPTFTAGEGTTVTVPYYNDITLEDQETYDNPLKPVDRFTITSKGKIGRLVVETDTPLVFVYDYALGVKTGDIKLPINYDITLVKTGDTFTIKVNNANVMISDVGTVKLDITNSIVWFDLNAAIYSKNNIVVDITDSKITGTLNSLTGLLVGSFNNLTINGSLQESLSGTNQFTAEEGVVLYSFNSDIVLLESKLLLDVLRDYPYNPAAMTYFWEDVVEHEQATVDIVTTPLGDEETEDITSLGMPLRIFRAYFRALAGQDKDIEGLVNKHDAALTVVSARKTFVEYAKRFQRLIRSVYKNYVTDKVDSTPAERVRYIGDALKALCNIDLTNEDCGCITGLDAGGTLSKKLEDIVADPTTEISDIYPTKIFNVLEGTRYVTVKGIKFVFPQPDSLSAWQKKVVCELAGWYYSAMLDTLEEVFGKTINFAAKNFSGVIKTVFESGEETSDDIAKTLWEFDETKGNGTVKVVLYNKLSYVSSLSGKINNVPVDIKLLHEMVHAMQYINLPCDPHEYGKWFVEGSAELSSGGIDKTRSTGLDWHVSTHFVSLLTEVYDISLNDTYVWGTIFMRWLLKTLAEERGWTQPDTGGGEGTDTTQGGGSDTTQGGSSDDTTGGGGNSDTTTGGGTDTTQGGGSDTTTGGGSDTTIGGGSDTTTGGSDDTTSGGSSGDTTGGGTSDTTSGGGTDTTQGSGSDTTTGGGSDTTTGGSDDTTSGGGASDTTSGGGSSDTSSGGGSDTTTGGSTDTTSGGTSDTTQGGGIDTTTGGSDDTTSGGGTDTTSGGSSDTTQGGGSDTTTGGTDTTTGGGSDTTSGGGTDTTTGGGSDTTSGGGSDTTTGGGTDTTGGGDTTQGGGTDTGSGGTTTGGTDTGSGGGTDTTGGGGSDTTQGGGSGGDPNIITVTANDQVVDLSTGKTVCVDAANVTRFSFTGTFTEDHKMKLFTGTVNNIVTGYSATVQGNGLKITGAYDITISGGNFETAEWSTIVNDASTYTSVKKSIRILDSAVSLDITVTETVTVTGIKSTADITVSNNVVTLTETALNNKDITISGSGYNLALDKSYSATTTDAHFDGFDYKSSSSTESYTLSADAKSISYVAAVPETVLFSLTGVKNTTDITVNNNVVTLTENNLNQQDVTISGTGYTLALTSGVKAPVFNNSSWTISGSTATYTSAGNTDGYVISSDARTVTYTSAVTAAVSLDVTGVKSTDGLLFSGSSVVVSESSLNQQTVTITSGYTLALDSSVTTSSTTPAGWTLNSDIATYKSEGVTAGYNLVNNTIVYTAATESSTLVTVNGVKNLTGIALNDKTVTISASALNNKDITISGTGYSLVLGSDVTVPIVTEAKWSLSGNTATYESGSTTAGYSLVSNSIVYTAATTSSTLVTVTGVKSLTGISLNDKTVTISESALNGSDITVSSGYTLVLDKDYSPQTTAAHFDGNSYKSESSTAGYTLADNKINYVAAVTETTLFTLTGIKTTTGITVNNKVVTLTAANLDEQDVTISGTGYTLALDQECLPTVTAAHFDGMDYKSGDSTAGYTISADAKTVSYVTATSATTLFTLTGVATTDEITVTDKTVTLKAANLNQQEVTISDNSYTLALASGVTLSTTAASTWTISGTTATYKSGKTTAGYKLADNKVTYTEAISSATLTKVKGVKSKDGLSVTGTVVTVSSESLNQTNVTIEEGYTLALGSDVGNDYSLIDNVIVYLSSTTVTLNNGQSLTDDISQYTQVVINGNTTVNEATISTDQPTVFTVKDANNLKIDNTIVPVNVGITFTRTGGSNKLSASQRCVRFDIANLKDTAVEFTNVVFLTANGDIIYAPVKTDITVNSSGAVDIPTFKGYLKRVRLSMTVNGSSYTSTALSSVGSGISYTEDPTTFLPTVSATYDVLKDYYYDCQTGRFSFEPARISESDFDVSVISSPKDLGDGNPSNVGMPLRVCRAYFKGLAEDTTTPTTVREAHAAGLTAVGAKENNLDYYVKQYYMTVKYLYNKYFGWKKTYTPASDDEATRLERLSNMDFYKELANIDLTNRDPGTVAGFDTSGMEEQLAADIISDPTNTISTDYPTTVCSYDSSRRQVTIDNITYVIPDPTNLADWEKRVICELCYWYLEKMQNALKYIFGFKMFSYNNSKYHQKLIEIVFDNVSNSSVSAQVTTPNATINEETKSIIRITINRRFSSWESTTSTADAFAINQYAFADNVLLHELVHVYQDLCLPYSHRLTGSWFIEGGAELLSQGIDMQRIDVTTGFDTPLFSAFTYNLTSTYSPTSDAFYPYIYGNIFLRWFFKRLSEERSWKHPIVELYDYDKVTTGYTEKYYRVYGTATVGPFIVKSPVGNNGKIYSIDVYFPETNTIRFGSGISYTVANASTGSYSITIGASTDDLLIYNGSTFIKYYSGFGAGSEAFAREAAVITSMTNCKLMLPGESSSFFKFAHKGYLCGISYSGNSKNDAYLDDGFDLWCSNGFKFTGINVNNDIIIKNVHTIDTAGSIYVWGRGAEAYTKQESFTRPNLA